MKYLVTKELHGGGGVIGTIGTKIEFVGGKEEKMKNDHNFANTWR